MIDNDCSLLNTIVFNDKATFHLSGNLNRRAVSKLDTEITIDILEHVKRPKLCSKLF